MPINIKLIAISMIIVFITSSLFGVGWTVRGWRADAQINALKTSHVVQLKRLSDEAISASESARRLEEKWQKSNAALTQRYVQEMSDEKEENKRLHAAVDAGAVQLRIHARCPTDRSEVPQTASSSNMADGSAIELDASARKSYFVLRGSIQHDQQMIFGLQQYVRDICFTPIN